MMTARPQSGEEGQAIVEYILLLSVIFVVAASFSRNAIRSLDASITTFNGQLERDLRTGRAGVDIWEN
jgi:hypothetical protein